MIVYACVLWPVPPNGVRTPSRRLTAAKRRSQKFPEVHAHTHTHTPTHPQVLNATICAPRKFCWMSTTRRSQVVRNAIIRVGHDQCQERWRQHKWHNIFQNTSIICSVPIVFRTRASAIATPGTQSAIPPRPAQSTKRISLRAISAHQIVSSRAEMCNLWT